MSSATLTVVVMETVVVCRKIRGKRPRLCRVMGKFVGIFSWHL